MSELHNDDHGIQAFEPEEGQRWSLCSNEVPLRCPSLGFNSNASEEEALKYLAAVLVEILIENKYENRSG
jgi:hypothetical protein